MKIRIVASCLLLSFAYLAFGQGITFQVAPKFRQFYQRNIADNDSGIVTASGTVLSLGKSQIHMDIIRNNGTPVRTSTPLSYGGSGAPFIITGKAKAGLAYHTVRIYVDDSLALEQTQILCGDAFLMSGQSNAARGGGTGTGTGFIRHYGGWAGYQENGNWDYDNYEWTQGTMGGIAARVSELIVARQQMPVCMINGALGGAPIQDFLPNLANHGDVSTLYGQHYWCVDQAHLRDKVRAFIWHQGESEDWGTAAEQRPQLYGERFDTLYKKWQADYPNIEKVYVFQTNTWCGGNSLVREKQRRLSETYGNLSVIATVGVFPGGDECHYESSDPGYWTFAEWLYSRMARDFYGAQDTPGVTSPYITGAWISGQSPTKVTLAFDQDVLWPADSGRVRLKNYLTLANGAGYNFAGTIETVIATGAHIELTLTAGTPAPTLISYLPNVYKETLYIKNARGLTALTFFEYPIAAEPPSSVENIAKNSECAIQAFPNPFNPTVTISYAGMQASLQAKIYSANGQSVGHVVLHNGLGVWDASKQPSGVYIIKLSANGMSSAKRVLLVK